MKFACDLREEGARREYHLECNPEFSFCCDGMKLAWRESYEMGQEGFHIGPVSESLRNKGVKELSMELFFKFKNDRSSDAFAYGIEYCPFCGEKFTIRFNRELQKT